MAFFSACGRFFLSFSFFLFAVFCLSFFRSFFLSFLPFFFLSLRVLLAPGVSWPFLTTQARPFSTHPVRVLFSRGTVACNATTPLRTCECVSNSVPKRHNKQGSVLLSKNPWTLGWHWPTKAHPSRRATCLLTNSDNFQFCPTHRLRLFQVHRSF